MKPSAGISAGPGTPSQNGLQSLFTIQMNKTQRGKLFSPSESRAFDPLFISPRQLQDRERHITFTPSILPCPRAPEDCPPAVFYITLSLELP